MVDAHILIVDDDADVLESARMFLKQEFARVDISLHPQEVIPSLSITPYDVILLDMNFSKGLNDGSEGFYWLSKILETDPSAVVVLFTAYGEVDQAVQAMKNGATDFVLKPWKNQKLLATLMAGLQLRRSKQEIEKLKRDKDRLLVSLLENEPELLGNSPVLEHMRQLIARVAPTDADVLILGENGTGKELVARSLHRLSSRVKGPFVHVDLGAISETLFESELFGHVKGAFTDARTDRVGRIESAAGGTLFLDEIGNLSLPMQAKLLTVLQQKKIQRLGTQKDIQIDFRLICATNSPLQTMVQKREFRQDLLYRLNTVEITVPPLRERKGDIALLARHFLEVFGRKYHRKLRLEASTLKAIEAYPWPGNVRELMHAMERAVILAPGTHVPVEMLVSSPPTSTPTERISLDEAEKRHIVDTLAANQGNVAQTARDLGLTRTALYRRLKRHGL